DQPKRGVTHPTTTPEVQKAKAQPLEPFHNIQIHSTQKQKPIQQLQTPLHHIQPPLNLHPHATTEQKQPFTNPLQHILSKPTQDISHQTTNPQIPTLKNTPLQQLKAQR
ncbi:DUF1542 domain-containing protein, partial [Staphylococcus aureus]|uniref:DUF1542 domain-containing protein n=1 Tax=Staphylococcus aureus TaxID=1280 RepID=UPI0011A03CAC